MTKRTRQQLKRSLKEEEDSIKEHQPHDPPHVTMTVVNTTNTNTNTNARIAQDTIDDAWITKEKQQQQVKENEEEESSSFSPSHSPNTPKITFQGVTYSTYEEMVKAKRAFNRQVLEKSGLLEASADLRTSTTVSKAAPRTQRGLARSTDSSKRKLKHPPATTIRRKSSRIAGIESDGMFIEEERMGGKVIIGGRTTSKEGDSLFTMPANVLVKEETTPLYYNNRVNDGSDLSMKDAVELTGSKWVQESSVARAQAFVSNLSENDIFLQRRKNDDDGGGGDDDHGSLDSPSETLFSSQVQYLSVDAQECVAKVVPDRIYSVAFHPCSHKLIATTGDKKGYLGLWDVDATLTDSSSGVAGGGGDDMDGVYLFKPHSGAINSLQWNQSGSKLLSQSYDGTIRLMDVERQVFVDAFAAYDDSEEFKGKIGYGMDEGNKYYTQFACYDDRNEECIFLSTSLGGVVHLDLRSKACVTFNVVLSDKKINSLSLHPNGYTLATAGLDCNVNLWDVRNMTGSKSKSKLKPYANLKSAKSINSAFFSPSGKNLLTTTMANTLDIINDAHLQNGLIKTPTHRIRHDNNTGRWLSTFMAQWHPTLTNEELFIVGSMARPRRMEFFNGDGNLIRGVDGEALTAVVSRCCFHPSTDRLIALGGNSSGRLTVAR